MDLIFCPTCRDILKLERKTRNCKCQGISGRQSQGISLYEGKAIPIRLNNDSLLKAIMEPNYVEGGHNFEAYVVSINDKSFRHI